MNPRGLSPTDIWENAMLGHFTRHIFQAAAWLDVARRTKDGPTLHYVALELRYGIEYLLFELLVLTAGGLPESEYRKIIGDPHGMKKKLKSPIHDYERLISFLKIILQVQEDAPKLQYWRLDDLFRSWGIASEYLHFCGAHSYTYEDSDWVSRGIDRLGGVVDEMWATSTSTRGIGIIKPAGMEPEVRNAFERFKSGKLSDEALLHEMKLIHPALRQRRMNRK